MKDIEFLVKLWTGRVTRFEKVLKEKIKELDYAQNQAKKVEEFNALSEKIDLLKELLEKYDLIVLK